MPTLFYYLYRSHGVKEEICQIPYTAYFSFKLMKSITVFLVLMYTEKKIRLCCMLFNFRDFETDHGWFYNFESFMPHNLC